MIVSAVVSIIEGENYRVTTNGLQSAAIKKLSHVCHLEIDFENSTVNKKPLEIGDKVLVYFESNGYSSGYILGLWEEG